MEYMRCLDCGYWHVAEKWQYETPDDLTSAYYNYCDDCWYDRELENWQKVITT